VEPQLENVVVELTPKAPFVAIFPFTVDNLEGDIFVRWARVNPQDAKVFFCSGGSARHQLILGGRAFVNQIGVENVELVTLDDFWWRVVYIVVSLVIFVPFESRVNPVEVARFPGTVLV